MENPLPDLPTVPMPATKPSQKGRKRRRVLFLVSGGLLLLGLGLASLLLWASPSHAGNRQQARSTQTILQGTQTAAAQRSPSALQGTRTRTPSAATPGPGATQQTGQPSRTYGRPHLGGPFSDFVGKYGPPDQQGETNSQNFWVGPEQTMVLNLSSNAQGDVTQLNAFGPPSWNAQQAKAYCTQFLPDQATPLQTTATHIMYQSSSGEVMLTVQEQSCTLAFVRA